MKFTLNKFVSTVAITGAAFAMTACGGSGDTATFYASDIPAVTVDAANSAAAKSIATALINTPAITLPALTPTTGAAIAAGSTLKFDATTSTTAGVLSGFTLTPPGGVASSGNLSVGSCVFSYTSGPLSGQQFVFSPCAFDLNTTGQAATGGTRSIPVVLTFGTTAVTTTVSGITLSTNGAGGVTVSIGGTTVGTATLGTAATGATGSSN